MKDFGGTSAATPNVAGLATLVWNFLNRPAPGIVYASMFAIGNNQLGAQDNDNGAGLPRWPGTADLIASSVNVSTASGSVFEKVTQWQLNSSNEYCTLVNIPNPTRQAKN